MDEQAIRMWAYDRVIKDGTPIHGVKPSVVDVLTAADPLAAWVMSGRLPTEADNG